MISGPSTQQSKPATNNTHKINPESESRKWKVREEEEEGRWNEGLKKGFENDYNNAGQKRDGCLIIIYWNILKYVYFLLCCLLLLLATAAACYCCCFVLLLDCWSISQSSHIKYIANKKEEEILYIKINRNPNPPIVSVHSHSHPTPTSYNNNNKYSPHSPNPTLLIQKKINPHEHSFDFVCPL